MVVKRGVSKWWKVLALVFLTIAVLETAFLISGYIKLQQDIERENFCIYDVCEFPLDPDTFHIYDAYLYDYETNVCQCFHNQEVWKQKVLD